MVQRLLIVVAALLASTAPAAAHPFTLSTATGGADVAVGPDGTGYFVAQGPAPAGAAFTDVSQIFCRAAPRASACSAPITLPALPGDVPNGPPRIFRRASDGELIVAQERCCAGNVLGTWVTTSSDSGATWTAPRKLSRHGNWTNDDVEMALTPDGKHLDVAMVITGPGSTPTTWFQRVPAAGASLDDPSPAIQDSGINLDPNGGLFAAVADTPAGLPIFVDRTVSGSNVGVGFRVGTGDLTTQSGWTPPTAAYLGDNTSAPVLAAGPTTPLLADLLLSSSGTGQAVELRRGAGFTDVQRMTAAGESPSNPGLAQDGDGTAQLVYPNTPPTINAPESLYYRWSSGPTDLHGPYPLADLHGVSLEVRVAADTVGEGWAAWTNLNSNDANPQTSDAVWLGVPGATLVRVTVSPRSVRRNRRTTFAVRLVGGAPGCGARRTVRLGGVGARTNTSGRATLRTRLRHRGYARMTFSPKAGCGGLPVAVVRVR